MTDVDTGEATPGSDDTAWWRGVPDRRFPWTGAIDREPVGSSWAFVVLIGAYGASMLVAVFATTPGLSSRYLLPIAAWGTCGVVWAGISGSALLRQAWALDKSNRDLDAKYRLLIEGIPLSAFIIYPAPYVAYRLLFLEQSSFVNLFNQPLVLVVTIQASILCVIIGIVNSSFAPAEEALPNNGPAKARDLELRLTNWWRSAQLAMTFFFAFGVGITASYYAQITADPGRTISGLGLHVVTSMVGIIGLACFVIVKFRIIHGKFSDALR